METEYRRQNSGYITHVNKAEIISFIESLMLSQHCSDEGFANMKKVE